MSPRGDRGSPGVRRAGGWPGPGPGMLPTAMLPGWTPLCPGAGPKPPSLVPMASSGVAGVLLTAAAKLAQREGEPQIAPCFPKSLFLRFGGELGCQGKAINCRNDCTRISYEGSAPIFK